MKRCLIFLILILPTFGAPQKPNILWIITDDQRLDSINAFNRITHGENDSPLGKVASPQVDRLAAMGTTFVNAFNQNPVCAPSRTVMHTGRYSHSTGIYGFDYYTGVGKEHWRPMVPEVMHEAGYRTVTVGKGGIRYIADPNKKSPPGPPYEVNLGYQNEFAAAGRFDWVKSKEWKTKITTDRFRFPDGSELTWSSDPVKQTDDREEVTRRLDILREYPPGKTHAEAVNSQDSIIGGVNPQPADKTREANFVKELISYLETGNGPYTTVTDKKAPGPGDAPVFAHLGFDFPHTPVLPPAEFRERFHNLKYKVPVFTDEEMASFTPQLRSLYKHTGSNHFPDAHKQQMIADYYALCAYGDSLVGQAVDAFIKHSEKSERPWLILYVCGDHGWKLNEHGMIAKSSPYDIDLHNPIIVVSSDKTKFPANKVVTDFTSFIDMAPTFFAAAGLDLTASRFDYLDGKDLAQVGAGTIPARQYIISEPTPLAVIRTKDYKLAMKVRPGKNDGKNMDWALKAELKELDPIFFDLRNDPDEIHNLALDPYYRPIVDALRTKLQNIVLGDARIECAWTRNGGEPVFTSNFAPGADDGRINLPTLSPKSRQRPVVSDASKGSAPTNKH